MRLEWDEDKRAANLLKHGLDFWDAARVLAGEVLEIEDDRYDYGKTRMIAVGLLVGRVVVVVYVSREVDLIRIISMRKAEKHEQSAYYHHLSL
jgi:uncharacterized protein